jgi:hypothetical protein
LTLTLMSAIAGCGGTTADPGRQTAQVSLTANPSTITPVLCPIERCGSVAGQIEAVTTVTIRETGGVAGRVDDIRMTLRRTSDNGLITEGLFTPATQTRFAANGTVSMQIAVHYDVAQGTSPATLTLAMAGTDDNNHQVAANGTVPVNVYAPPGVIAIAGTYQIVQRAIETTCGDTGTPASVTGTVNHTPGATPFVLSDSGGTTFTGNVQQNGTFTANAVFGPDSGGQTYTQRLEGTFTASGFTARLNVDVTPRNCRFARDWTGTKQ